MTRRAVLIARIGHIMALRLSRDAASQTPEVSRSVVTLQAQREHYRPQQQPRICRPVRSVAGFAPIHPSAEMLEYEGTSLIGVAVETGLLIRHGLVHVAGARGHSPGGSKGAMRIMAVGTGHRSFLDAVLEGHRELYAHIGMATFAERGLGLAQQRAIRLGAMNRMAAGACHSIQSVLRAPYIRPRQLLTVAA